jgi:hypothetical protein
MVPDEGTISMSTTVCRHLRVLSESRGLRRTVSSTVRRGVR